MLQAQTQLWGTLPCVAQHPLPTYSHAQPQPPHLCALLCWTPGPPAASEAGVLGALGRSWVCRAPWQPETGPWGVSWVVSGQQALPASSSFPVGLTPPWARSPGNCTGPHGQGVVVQPLPRGGGRVTPHRPDPVGSSAVTVTVSQPCLEFTELGLASMAAASAHSNFCSQNKQRRMSAQTPTREVRDPP